MKRYSEVEMKNFVRVMDKHLASKTTLIVIGGSAALLAYHAGLRTNDIDTYNKIPEPLRQAHAAAQKETGMEVPLGPAGVIDFPYNMEDRLIVLDLGLIKLEVKVPDPIDLVLMKTVRGVEHDLKANVEIISNEAISLDHLVDRFNKEMGHVHGDRNILKLNLLALIEEAFPSVDAKDVAKQIGYKLRDA